MSRIIINIEEKLSRHKSLEPIPKQTPASKPESAGIFHPFLSSLSESEAWAPTTSQCWEMGQVDWLSLIIKIKICHGEIWSFILAWASGWAFEPPSGILIRLLTGLPAAREILSGRGLKNSANFNPDSAEACAKFLAKFYRDKPQGVEGIIGGAFESPKSNETELLDESQGNSVSRNFRNAISRWS